MTIKESDCIKLKRNGAEHVAKLLAGKSKDEILEFWKLRTQKLIEKVEQKKKSASKN